VADEWNGSGFACVVGRQRKVLATWPTWLGRVKGPPLGTGRPIIVRRLALLRPAWVGGRRGGHRPRGERLCKGGLQAHSSPSPPNTGPPNPTGETCPSANRDPEWAYSESLCTSSWRGLGGQTSRFREEPTRSRCSQQPGVYKPRCPPIPIVSPFSPFSLLPTPILPTSDPDLLLSSPS
jgi:hypothetical protein